MSGRGCQGVCDGCATELTAGVRHYHVAVRVAAVEEAGGAEEQVDEDAMDLVLCERCRLRMRSELLTLCGAPDMEMAEVLH